MRAAAIAAVVILSAWAPVWAQAPYWEIPMQEVHANFTGQHGTIARFGDSITVSLAFFKPLQLTTNLGAATDATNWIRGYVNPADCWNWYDDGRYVGNGANGGMDSYWPLAVEQHPPQTNIAHWLGNLNPEMAVIMWGTNDIAHGVPQATFVSNMRQVVQAVKNNGTIPVLTTIPPRRDNVTASASFAQAIRDLAVEQQVPYVDYYSAIMTRRPDLTWYGTLISGDGVHPSYTSNDFSENTLNNSGYTLRNYETVLKLREVYNEAIVPEPATVGLLLLGAGGLAVRRRRR